QRCPRWRWQRPRSVFVPHVGGVPGAAAPSGSRVPSRGGAIPVPRLPAVYLRKLADEEQPLRLRLLAGPSEKALSFVLKENESGEVNWDAFSLPELHNFLRILQREEDEQLRRVRH
ncbi:ras association domain-containing protein 1-like, partial [Meleagris gallopavo]|uniref:ras association domain-containing protein 1-like n=1 Tax=Meleagris gallopavo TaxID=9103 RepID=UPI000549C98C